MKWKKNNCAGKKKSPYIIQGGGGGTLAQKSCESPSPQWLQWGVDPQPGCLADWLVADWLVAGLSRL
eukprot:1158662-Pelagomonas_calceolata.AAC.4